jgi:S1-C subfamily serine protease
MLVFLAGPASAADYQTLRSLKAPEPRALAPLPAGPQTHTVKFARLAFQLQPQPWAILEGELDGRSYSEHVLVWNEGQVDVDQTMISQIVAEEMTAAHIPVEGATQSLFAQATTADLQLGVTITDMTGRFCRACATGLITSAPSTNWAGVVVLTARWEVYSTLDRKVVATVETRGGFNTSKAGLPGTPERLIYEALRDGSRRLIASEEFRRVVATPLTTPSAAASGAGNAPIVLLGPQTGGTLTQAMASVAIVFAAGGSGSGFLVSKDGYVLTNHHVAGDAKYVKLKWSNGEETLGEVIRSDRRRDVALVKTDAKGRAPLALRTGSVQLGESVFAIGTPLDDKLQNTLTKGIVSANRVYEGQPFIQSDVAVTHGNSGGPLLDEKGRVLGLTVSGRAPDGAPVGLNFFIPIDDALRALALKPAA